MVEQMLDQVLDQTPDQNPDEIETLIRNTARKHGADENLEDLAVEVARQESRFKPKATGPQTKYGRAKGLFQFIDDTAKQYGVNDPYDPAQSADAGVRYLKDLHKQYNGDTSKILAAYNWGSGNLQKHGMEKAPTETRDYITDINAHLELNKLYKQASGGAIQPKTTAPATTQPTTQPATSGLSPEDELDQLFQQAQIKPAPQPLNVGVLGKRTTTQAAASQPRQSPQALDTSAFKLADSSGKSFGFSKPEVDAYTQAYGVHPAQDPSVQARAANFLNARRVNDVIPGQRVGLLESGFVPSAGTGQKAVGEFGGAAVNRFTLGNATLPEYDPSAPVDNQSGGAFDELINPRNVGGVVGDVGNLLGVSGVLKGVGAGIEALGQGSKYANAAGRLLGSSPAASRIESGLHTGTLFGTQAGLSNPDPVGKMTLAQNISARVQNAIKSGTVGSISGMLAGVDPSLLRETLSFIAPGTAKTVIGGYLEGKKPEEILSEVSQEQLPNAIFPLAARGIGTATSLLQPRGELAASTGAPVEADAQAPPTAEAARRMQINQRVAAQNKPFTPPIGSDVQPVVNGERVPRTVIQPRTPPQPPAFEPALKQPGQQPEFQALVEQPTQKTPIGDQITERVPVKLEEPGPASTDQATTNTVEPKYFLNPAEWEDVGPKINQQLDNSPLGQMIDTLQASGLNATQIKEYLAKHPESQQAIIDSAPDPEFVTRIKNASIYPEASALMDQINQEMAARGYDPQDIGDTDIKRELPELHAQVQAAMKPYREKYQQMLAKRQQELNPPTQVVPPSRLSSRSATAKILPVAPKGEANVRPAEAGSVAPTAPPSGLAGSVDPSPPKEQFASPAEPVIINKRTDTARVPKQPAGQQPVAPDRPPQEVKTTQGISERTGSPIGLAPAMDSGHESIYVETDNGQRFKIQVGPVGRLIGKTIALADGSTISTDHITRIVNEDGSTRIAIRPEDRAGKSKPAEAVKPQEVKPALVEPPAKPTSPLPEGVTRQGKAFVAPDGKQFTGPGAKDNAEFYTKQRALVGAKVRNYQGNTDIVEKVEFRNDQSRIPTYTVRDEKTGVVRQHSTPIDDKQVIQRPGRVRISARGIETDIKLVDKASTATAFKPLATGKESKAATERGTEIKTRFAIVEASQLNTSHDTNLKQNPNYPQELQPRDRSRAASEEQISRIAGQLRPEFLADSPKASDGAPIIGDDYAVESGNGRSIALRRAYEKNSDKATAYKQYLIDHAEEFGLDRKAIEQAKNPVLVRVRESKVDRAKFTAEANEGSVARMSPVEQARADAKQLKGDLLNRFYPTEDGEIFTAANRKGFIPEFLDKVVGPDHGAYLDKDGNLNQDGIKRIRDAVFASVYGDTPEGVKILQKISESPDSNIKAVANALLKNANKFAGLKGSDLDITPDLMKAVAKLSTLREQGQTVSDYLKQQTMFGDELDPLQKDILRAIDANKRSTKAISEILGKYADSAKPAGSLLEASKLDKATLFEQAIKEGDEQTRLFQSPEARRVDAKLSTDELPEKLRAQPGQRYSTEGTKNIKPSAAHVVGPNRERVAKQFADVFKRPPAETDAIMTVGDAIATAWAKREGKPADEFYARLSVEKGSHSNPKFKGETDLRTFAKDGKAVIRALNNPDASTAFHELAHVGRRYLSESDQKILNNWVYTEHGAKAFSINGSWNRNAEEAFARGFERYLNEGNAPTTKLAKVFANIKQWMTDIYGSIKEIIGIKGHQLNVNITDEVRGVMDRMLGGKGEGPRDNNGQIGSNGTKGSSTENVPYQVPGGVSDTRTHLGNRNGASDGSTVSAVQEGIKEPSVSTRGGAVSRVQSRVSGTAKETLRSSSINASNASAGETASRSLPKSAKPYLHPEAQLEPQEYSRLTNASSFEAARKAIADDPEEAYHKALDPNGGAHENAIAMEMISRAQRDGDWSKAKTIMNALSDRATEQGQAVQLFAAISKIAPDGVVRYADNILKKAAKGTQGKGRADSIKKQIVDAINKGEDPASAIQRLFQRTAGAKKDLADQLAKAVKDAKTKQERDTIIGEYVGKHFKVPGTDVEFNAELHEMATKAAGLSGIDRAIAVHQMMAAIAEKLPSKGIGAKLADVYTAGQLFNPRTMVKFFIGHNVFPLVELAKDIPATAIDATRAAITGGERTTVLPSVKKYVEGWKRGWQEGGIAQAAGAPAMVGLTNEIVPRPEAFKGATGKALLKAHNFFSRTARSVYTAGLETSLDQQMRAAAKNGETLSAPTPEMMERAAGVGNYFALQETSQIAKTLTQLKKGLNLGQNFGLGNLIINYPKIQGNLLSRTLEYSPLGFLRTGYEVIQPALGKERVNTKDFTDHLTRALIGTTGTAFAYMLASRGLLRDQGSTGFRGESQEEEEGKRKYQINISGLKRWFLSGFNSKEAEMRTGDQLATYDWLEPWAGVANMGAAIYRKSPTGMADALSGGLESLGDSPAISGIRQAIGDKSGVKGALANFAQNTPASFVPTVVKQIRKFTDDTRRDTTTTTAEDPYGIKESYNRLKNALPGASKTLPAQVGPFGDDKTYSQPGSSTARNVANTFISPAQTSTYQPTKEGKYLVDLADQVGEKEANKFLPAAAPKSVKVKDEFGNETDRELTGQERQDYQRYRGPLLKEQASMAANSPSFGKLQPRTQAQKLEQGNSRINAAARVVVSGDQRPGYSRKAENPVPRDQAIFEHNAKVDAAHQETLDSLKSNSHWREIYERLNDDQKDFARRELTALYSDLKVKEDAKATPAQLERETSLAGRALSHLTGYEIQRILNGASKYKK